MNDLGEINELFENLEVGLRVSDTQFDKIFPIDDRKSARVHWTSVSIALDVVGLRPRVRFLWMDMEGLDWGQFDGIYLYNPFFENIDESIRIDSQIELQPKLFDRYVAVAYEKLNSLKSGARVVTYYGFGGKFPSSFQQLQLDPSLDPHLECWVKE